MARNVGIADLKARLAEHLRAVEKGEILTVVRYGNPVAEVTPPRRGKLRVQPPTRKLSAVKIPPRPRHRTDSLAVLRDGRGRRRGSSTSTPRW